jgi:hypothetical protein
VPNTACPNTAVPTLFATIVPTAPVAATPVKVTDDTLTLVPADASGPEARGAKPSIRVYLATSQRRGTPLASAHHVGLGGMWSSLWKECRQQVLSSRSLPEGGRGGHGRYPTLAPEVIRLCPRPAPTHCRSVQRSEFADGFCYQSGEQGSA